MDRKTENISLLQVTRDDEAKWYKVTLDNGYVGRYPYVWLRDNCRCLHCCNPKCGHRESFVVDLDPEVVPVSEAVVDDGQALRVVWPGDDQHQSTFDVDWLDAQRFSESPVDPIASAADIQIWGREEMNGKIPCFDYEEILNSDLVLYRWLLAIHTAGIALVQDAPKKKGAVRKLSSRIAFLKRTIYGEEFTVEVKPSDGNISNLGSTVQFLPLHTDVPYYESPPGLQFLHCIVQTKGIGGENQFVDGHNLVRKLKKDHPDIYKILTTLPIYYDNCAKHIYEYHIKFNRPIIDYDYHGDLCMRYNDPIRASTIQQPVEKVTEIYRAIKTINSLMNQPENMIHHKTAEGEIVTFNNRRLLHGRSAFEIDCTVGTSRLLEGCYMEKDDVQSRMRVLREGLLKDNLLDT